MTHPDFGLSKPLTPPLYPSAVYTLPDLDALDAIYEHRTPGFIYARDGHPNATQLASELTQLSAAQWGVVTGSGMGAIAAACLAFLKAGDRVLLSRRLYGKTIRLLQDECTRFGVVVELVDSSDLAAVANALQASHYQLMIVETLSNPLCRVADIPQLAHLTHDHQCRLLVDNTFASPVMCRPLELGADLVMESLTKIINGASDITLGFLAGRQTADGQRVASVVSTWGLAANPFDCWLTMRNLSTLDLRVRTASTNALAVARWLKDQPAVSRVVYPGLTDHPDHALAGRLLEHGYGHMLCFELAGGRKAVNTWMRATPQIPFAPSLGHSDTTCSHPATTSHRYETPEARAAEGITDGLIRLSVGCEPLEPLLRILAQGLQQLGA